MPKNKKQINYEKKLRDMITKEYGKGWGKLPACEWEIEEDYIYIQYRTEHFLNNFLRLSPMTDKMNATFKRTYCDDWDNARDFARRMTAKDKDSWYEGYTRNNSNSILTNDFSYIVFQYGEAGWCYDDNYYIILEIDGKYMIFQIRDHSYFDMALTDVSAQCMGYPDSLSDKKQKKLFNDKEIPLTPCQALWDSDDGGENWYDQGEDYKQRKVKAPKILIIKDKEDSYKAVCSRCNAKVEFFVMESF